MRRKSRLLVSLSEVGWIGGEVCMLLVGEGDELFDGFKSGKTSRN